MDFSTLFFAFVWYLHKQFQFRFSLGFVFNYLFLLFISIFAFKSNTSGFWWKCAQNRITEIGLYMRMFFIKWRRDWTSHMEKYKIENLNGKYEFIRMKVDYFSLHVNWKSVYLFHLPWKYMMRDIYILIDRVLAIYFATLLSRT